MHSSTGTFLHVYDLAEEIKVGRLLKSVEYSTIVFDDDLGVCTDIWQNPPISSSVPAVSKKVSKNPFRLLAQPAFLIVLAGSPRPLLNQIKPLYLP